METTKITNKIEEKNPLLKKSPFLLISKGKMNKSNKTLYCYYEFLLNEEVYRSDLIETEYERDLAKELYKTEKQIEKYLNSGNYIILDESDERYPEIIKIKATEVEESYFEEDRDGGYRINFEKKEMDEAIKKVKKKEGKEFNLEDWLVENSWKYNNVDKNKLKKISITILKHFN